MLINCFGKKRKAEDGHEFTSYFGTLVKKDGTEVNVGIKFRQDCGNPKKVPCVIEFEKKNGNLVQEVTEDGAIYNTLWITEYNEHEYIDTSLDEFE